MKTNKTNKHAINTHVQHVHLADLVGGGAQDSGRDPGHRGLQQQLGGRGGRKQLDTMDTLKSHLKTHFYSLAFNTA